jgi:ATP-dependent RNA helicase CshB
LHLKNRIFFDKETNDKIKYIIKTNSKKVKPGYKRKISNEIGRIKQKLKHQYIEKKVKENLMKK